MHTSSFSTIINYLNLYTDIQTKLPFTKVLPTKTDEKKKNDASGRVNLF